VKRWLVDRGGLLALLSAVVYIAVASPAIADGDNAELVTLGRIGGVAHPSGYPLYLVWLRVTAWLPGSTAASTAAIATALLATAQVLVLHAACRAWGARPLAATIAVAIYAGAPTVLRYHSEAEVFALNGLVVATILWLAAGGGPVRGTSRAIALALVAGLGMANHMSCTLLAPVGLVGVVRGIRESRARALACGGAMVALVVGLAPYAYLAVTSGSSAAWGPVSSFDDLIGTITRRDYGGVGAFAAVAGDTSVAANFAAFASTLARTWLWLPALAGIGAFVWRIVRPGQRTDWIALTASWLVAGPLVVASFNIPPEQLGLYICQRFYLLPSLLLAIPVAVAIDAALARISVRPVLQWAAPLVFIAAAATSLGYLGRVRTTAVELSARNLLRSLPANAVVITRSDDMFYAPIYLQETEGERPDVAIVSWWLLAHPWYRQRLAERGLVLDPYAPTPGPFGRRIATQVFAMRRPLFTELDEPRVAMFDSAPYGIVAQVYPPGTPRPSIDEIAMTNRTVFSAFDLSDPKPGVDDEYPTAVHSRYGFTWVVIAKAFAAAGRPDDAKAAIAVAREIGPQR
jgi:hypothetical protein